MLIQGLKFLANVILYPIWMIGYIVELCRNPIHSLVERVGALMLGLLGWVFGAFLIYLNI